MCEFKSAIVMRNGDVLHNPWTDSHEDLIRLYKLRDTKGGVFARVEFKPKNLEDIADPKKYLLTIDEYICPEWFNEDMKAKVSDRMRGWINSMIVSGDADLLCGGVYLLAKGAKIACVKNCRIVVMADDSNIGTMMGSSNIGTMWESSKVGEMWESSKVGEMRGSSKVGAMLGSSNIGTMWESSKVLKDNKPTIDLREAKCTT